MKFRFFLANAVDIWNFVVEKYTEIPYLVQYSLHFSKDFYEINT